MNDETKAVDPFARLESEVRSYCRAFPTVFARARDHLLIDERGREYIDFFAGAGTLNYGHNPPDMVRALVSYLESEGITHALDMSTAAKRTFLERFEETVLRPRRMEYRIQFTGPTGADAVEAALKLARLVKGRPKVLAFTNAYHGMTLGALALTNNRAARAAAGVPLEHVLVAPYEGFMGQDGDTLGHLETTLEIARRRDDAPAAIVLETVQAEGGINVASGDWLQGVEALARRYDALLVVDDIQAGCGRTGPFFSFEPAGIEPDIVILSKSLSGFGLPLSCVLIRPESDVWAPGQHTGTFRGNNLAFVTGAQALERWRSDDLTRAVLAKGERVRERLDALRARHSNASLDLRGRGLMWGLDFGAENFGAKVARACFERGLVIETAGPTDNVLKLLPPLTIDEAALDAGLTIIEGAVSDALAG